MNWYYVQPLQHLHGRVHACFVVVFLSEGDYKAAMYFMQVKSEVHVVAEIACHQIQSVEMKSTQAYDIYSFLRCERNLSFSHMC